MWAVPWSDPCYPQPKAESILRVLSILWVLSILLDFRHPFIFVWLMSAFGKNSSSVTTAPQLDVWRMLRV